MLNAKNMVNPSPENFPFELNRQNFLVQMRLFLKMVEQEQIELYEITTGQYIKGDHFLTNSLIINYFAKESLYGLADNPPPSEPARPVYVRSEDWEWFPMKDFCDCPTEWAVLAKHDGQPVLYKVEENKFKLYHELFSGWRPVTLDLEGKPRESKVE